MNKKTYPITNIGSVSLIMIFIVLCMVIFAVLSLSTASADRRLGAKFSTHTTEYYTASNAAEELLEEIDEILATSYNQPISTMDYYDTVTARLMKLQDVELQNNSELSFHTAINDSQALSVELHILSPEEIRSLDLPAFYRITCWKEISIKKREENTMNLIQIIP